ncbi:MAG: RHS repeat protein, partial [Verrucomicrobia bacterium]|nr:RHS repeat protein [Verrucomicrobiota bacterium]
MVTYEYLPNTNLVTAKLTYEGSKVVLRELARYDECNNLIEKIEDHKITRYHLRQTAPFLHLPESIEELCDQGLLKRTHLAYDERGNVVRETVYGADGHLAYAIDREYNERGDILSEINPLGQRATYSYDERGRLITTQPFSNRLTTTNFYDLQGRLLQSTDHGDEGTVHTTSYSYDFKDRCTQKTDPLSNITSYIYDPLTDKPLQINQSQILTSSTYDALGREISKTDANGNITTTTYNQEKVYDPHGNLISQADQVYVDGRKTGLQIIRYAYTPTHHIERLTRAFGTKEARTTSYTSTPSGRLATKTTPNGKTLSYSYSPLGFLTERRSSDGAISHSFIYNKLGRLISAIDEVQNIAIDREVDSFGNVLRERFPSGLEVKKEYDALDRPLSLTLGQEGVVFYSYDPLYLRKVERYSPTGQLLYTHERKGYDLSGNLTCEELIGGVAQVRYTTDQCGRNESLVSPYLSQQCRYDGCGNLVGCDEEESHTYTYDALSQLTSEISKSNAQVYQYDSLHNRLAKNEEAYRYNSLNELTQVKYDLNGNQLVSGEWELVYDPLNQLIEAKRGGRSLQFVYDPFGRRLSATIKEGGTQAREEYLYDGQEEIGS